MVYLKHSSDWDGTKGGVKDESVWNTDASLPYTVRRPNRAWHGLAMNSTLTSVINPRRCWEEALSAQHQALISFRTPSQGNTRSSPNSQLRRSRSGRCRAHRRAYEVDDAEGRFILAPHVNLNGHHLQANTNAEPINKAPSSASPTCWSR